MQKLGRVRASGLGRALGDVRVTSSFPPSFAHARAALVSQLSCSPLHSALSGGDGRTERRTDSYDGRGGWRRRHLGERTGEMKTSRHQSESDWTSSCKWQYFFSTPDILREFRV